MLGRERREDGKLFLPTLTRFAGIVEQHLFHIWKLLDSRQRRYMPGEPSPCVMFTLPTLGGRFDEERPLARRYPPKLSWGVAVTDEVDEEAVPIPWDAPFA